MIWYQCLRKLHITSPLNKVQAGRYKRTPHKTLPLTYEQAQRPEFIGVSKTWNSMNTSTLNDAHDPDIAGAITIEDAFIRKFMLGTWHKLFLSEVVIKRRHNRIFVAGIVQRNLPPRKLYFLFGYTEELLSNLLKCPLKLELQSVESSKDTVFTYI